jgi:hypothetical protein
MAGRDSTHRFVSGVPQHARQGQVTAVQVVLCTAQQVTHLRAQFAVFVPSQNDGFKAEQRLGDVAMRRARERGIKRMQGAQMQNRGAGGGLGRIRTQRMPFKGLRLRAEGVKVPTEAPCQRHRARISGPIHQVAGERQAHPFFAHFGRERQLPAVKAQPLAARDPPQVETQSTNAARVRSTYL